MLMLAMSWAKPDRKREIERRRETQRERRRGTERGSWRERERRRDRLGAMAERLTGRSPPLEPKELYRKKV